MAKRILITGAGGFLGSRLFEYFNGREVFEAIGVSHRELDITDSLAVTAFIQAIRPDVVLHCAAISNTGQCEADPKLSEQVNVYGTANVAKACRQANCRMIFMSSDQIYTGSDTLEPNCEGSERRPRGVYGRDKKRAEEAMFAQTKEAVALRLTWMYDYPSEGRVPSANLVTNIIKARETGTTLSYPVNDHRGITYVWEVVRNMEKAMDLPGGVYNFGSSNELNAFETATAFARVLTGQKETDNLVRQDRERFCGCPRNLTINTDKLSAFGIRFHSTLQGLGLCCSEHGLPFGGNTARASG